MLSVKDVRVPQAKKLIEGIVSKSDLAKSDIMITGDNTLVIIVRDTVMYTVKLNDVPCLPSISFRYVDLTDEGEYIPNNYLLYNISSLYNYYNSSTLLKLASEPVLRGNDEFENLLNLKSSDGAEFFKINGSSIGECYFVPIFSGFPAINKADKIGIDIYDLRDGHLLVNMNIFKKKINRDIKMYFRTINLS